MYCGKLIFSLQSHGRKHSGEKLRCPNKGCDKKCLYKTSLMIHLRSGCAFQQWKSSSSTEDCELLATCLVLSTGQNTVILYSVIGCMTLAVCKRSDLNKHMLVHTQEKGFECKECNKLFARKSSLVSHMICTFRSPLHSNDFQHSELKILLL